MGDKVKTNLRELQNGQSAEIVRVDGGHGAQRRIESMGLRAGKIVKKISSMFLGGPVTVQVGHTRVSMGRGMAQKVIVKVLE